MNGIVIGISPTIAQRGPFAPRWYGLFFMLAIVAGVWLGLREARRLWVGARRPDSTPLASKPTRPRAGYSTSRGR